MVDYEMAARLRRARQIDGRFKGPTEAARALRIEPPTYLGHENGARGFKAQAPRYAGFYKVDLKWLITGVGSPRGAPVEARILSLDPEQQKQVMGAIELFESLKANRKFK